MSKAVIGGMSLDGMDAEQLEAIMLMAGAAEDGFDELAMFGHANQCMVLRNRAREAYSALIEAEVMEMTA